MKYITKIRFSALLQFLTFFLSHMSVVSYAANIETVDASGGYGVHIALDSNNNTHIGYIADEGLMYATNESGAWVTTQVDTVGFDISIAIDSNNKVHLSYFDVTNARLKYATNNTGSWITYTIDDLWSYGTKTFGRFTSIAIDSNDKIHISYCDPLNNDLKYITNTSGAWLKYVVYSSGDVGLYSSIAIDLNNKVHISYYDDTNGKLKYATNTSGIWVIREIDNIGAMGGISSIAIDSVNNVHVSYNNAPRFLINDSIRDLITLQTAA